MYCCAFMPQTFTSAFVSFSDSTRLLEDVYGHYAHRAGSASGCSNALFLGDGEQVSFSRSTLVT